MRLFYSGATTFLGVQIKSFLSLGGFISSTPIPNSLAGNIFGDISTYTIEKKLTEYRLVVIKNEFNYKVTSILFWFLYPETYPFCKYEIAAVRPTISEGEAYFEHINTTHESPAYIEEWYEADGEINQLDIGDLESGEYLGIWIKRTILPEVDQYFTDQAIIDNYKLTNPVIMPTEDKTLLKLSWSD